MKKRKKAPGNSLRQNEKKEPQNNCLRTISTATLHSSFFTFHSSLFTIIVPPSGREGDHEVVEGARGRKSKAACLIAGGYEIRPYGNKTIQGRFHPTQKQLCHFAVRQNFTPQVFHLPLAANFTRRRRISLCNCPGSCTLGDREAVDEENILWQL